MYACGSVASESLFAWGRFAWCSDDHHTGVIIGPMYSYDLVKKRWSQRKCFEELYGQTYQLFFDDGSFVYYAGRYTALGLRPLHAGGVDLPAKGMVSKSKSLMFLRE